MNQDVIKKEDIERANISATCVTAPFIDDPVVVQLNTNSVNKTEGAKEIEITADENIVVNKTRRHAPSYEESGDL